MPSLFGKAAQRPVIRYNCHINIWLIDKYLTFVEDITCRSDVTIPKKFLISILNRQNHIRFVIWHSFNNCSNARMSSIFVIYLIKMRTGNKCWSNVNWNAFGCVYTKTTSFVAAHCIQFTVLNVCRTRRKCFHATSTMQHFWIVKIFRNIWCIEQLNAHLMIAIRCPATGLNRWIQIQKIHDRAS